MPSQERNSAGRFPLLDGLRAIAILLVVLFHETHILNLPKDRASQWLHAFLMTGWIGVFLFFVLSGFLIGTLSFREIKATQKLNVRTFWARRFFRTWPLYFILLAFNYSRATEVSPPIGYYLTFTQNFKNPQFFMQSWSLAVEEQFYLILPLILYLLVRIKRLSILPALLLFGIVLAYIYRCYFGVSWQTPAVMDSLLIGVAIAYANEFHPDILEPVKQSPNTSVLCGILLVYVPLFLSERFPQIQPIMIGTLGIGFGSIIVACLRKGFIFEKCLTNKVMVFIALVSYSIYLSHDRIIFRLGKWADGAGLGGYTRAIILTIITVAGTTALGALLYFAIEKPGLKLRDILFPRKAK